jgi:hypothetical protein
MKFIDKIKVRIYRTKRMLCSGAFWDGVFSVWCPWYAVELYDKRRKRLNDLKRELDLFQSDKITSDFRAVEGYLWSAMNEFEKQYGDDPHKTFSKEPPSSEEILKRFAALSEDYDKANIPCQCVNCTKKGYTSHFRSKDGLVRCNCGGICVPLKKNDGVNY